jgi:hypothetical protein
MTSLPASVDIPDVSAPELTDDREESVLDLTMTWSGKVRPTRRDDEG